MEKEENNFMRSKKEGYVHKNVKEEEASKDKILKQNKIWEQQQRDIQVITQLQWCSLVAWFKCEINKFISIFNVFCRN